MFFFHLISDISNRICKEWTFWQIMDKNAFIRHSNNLFFIKFREKCFFLYNLWGNALLQSDIQKMLYSNKIYYEILLLIRFHNSLLFTTCLTEMYVFSSYFTQKCFFQNSMCWNALYSSHFRHNQVVYWMIRKLFSLNSKTFLAYLLEKYSFWFKFWVNIIF